MVYFQCQVYFLWIEIIMFLVKSQGSGTLFHRVPLLPFTATLKHHHYAQFHFQFQSGVFPVLFLLRQHIKILRTRIYRFYHPRITHFFKQHLPFLIFPFFPNTYTILPCFSHTALCQSLLPNFLQKSLRFRFLVDIYRNRIFFNQLKIFRNRRKLVISTIEFLQNFLHIRFRP